MAENLPKNIDAEKSVIGAMLISSSAIIEIFSLLEEDDFFDGKHRIIYSAIKQVENKHIPVDVQTITEELINMKELDSIGGVEYLLELSDMPMSLSNVKHYANIVKDQSLLRQMLLKMTEIQRNYEKEEIENIPDFISDAKREIDRIAEQRRISEFQTAEQVTKKVRQKIADTKASTDDVTGIPTGYPDLNRLTHGFQKGDIVIVAARPSVGKTAFGLNLAFNAANLTRRTVAIFSLEMPSEQLIARLLANRSTVDLGRIQTAYLNSADIGKLDAASREISNTKLYIDDTPGIKLADIIAKATKLKKENDDLALILIDYIGLITVGGKKIENRQLEVSEISRSLKQLARELEVPIIVICQLSRAVEERSGKRPMLSDLRESGSIEQDADMVFLLFREDYYSDIGVELDDKKKKGKIDVKPEEKKISNTSIIKIGVAKNRNGMIGEVELLFIKNIGRFDSVAKVGSEE